jgi:hypothetical protein
MVEEENVCQLSCTVASVPTTVYTVGLDLTNKYEVVAKRCINREQSAILPKLTHFRKLNDRDICKNSEVAAKSVLSF